MSLYHRVQWARFHLNEGVKIYDCQYWQGKWSFMDIFTASQLWVNALTIIDFILRMNGLEQSIMFVKNIECHKSNIFHILIAVFWKMVIFFHVIFKISHTWSALLSKWTDYISWSVVDIYNCIYIYKYVCLCVILRHRKVSFSHCVIRHTIESASHHY